MSMDTPFKTLQDIDQFIDHIEECKCLVKTIHIAEFDPDDKTFGLIGPDNSFLIRENIILKLANK